MLHLRSTTLRPPRPPADGRHRDVAPRRRRSLVVGASVVVTGLILAAVPGSAPAAGPTTAVSFVPISPAKVVMNNAYVGPNATSSVAVAGGSTTVPSSATTVQLLVTVKGAQGGTLKVFPMGLPASGDSIAFAAGNVLAAATVNETVGLSDKISVTNVSTAAATVTTKIVGYSTQVTAAAINGSGGTPGQVLTNTGSGAAWGPSSTAYGSQAGAVPMPLNTYTVVGSLVVPAGSYFVDYAGDLFDSAGSMNVYCYLRAPNGALITGTYDSTPAPGRDTAMAIQGLLSTSAGGTVQMLCYPYGGSSPYMYSHSLTAISVGAVSGSFAISARTKGGRIALPRR